MKADTNQPTSSPPPPHPSPSKPLSRTHPWRWTGFASKTLWDWLQLLAVLAVPLALGLATYGFNAQQAILAQNQHVADQQGTLDQQRETELQSYLDRMSDLLLGNNKSTPPAGTTTGNDPFRQIARARTLTVLRDLDERRKGLVLQFLYDAKLIGYPNSPQGIVDLHGADLAGVSPGEGVNLSGINLSGGVDLSGANLDRANLSGANLDGANLGNAHLTKGANLSQASLNGANLSGANLSNANMTGVQLVGGANLSNTILAGANLVEGNLQGAVLPKANLSGAELWHADLRQTNLGEANLNGADLSESRISTTTYLVNATYTSRTNWPDHFDSQTDRFDPQQVHAIKTNLRVLPAFVDLNVQSSHYHLANATLQPKDLAAVQNHVALNAGQQIALEFDLQEADLAKTVVTVTGLISQNGPNNPGYAPISLQFKGHPPFQLNYTVSGGGYQPTSQSFSASSGQLVAGSNTLILTVAPDATTQFWLYRLEVGIIAS